MNNVKLGVKVVSAHNLMPKDGQVSSNHFVELHFDRQRVCTTIKAKDLNPVWNENFYFNISDPSSLSKLYLDAYVYRNIKVKSNSSRSILGKVHLTDTSFVPAADAKISPYPLEKPSMFSRVTVKGELALRVYLTDDPILKSSSNLLPAFDPSAIPDLLATSQTTQPQVHVPNPMPTTAPVSNDGAEPGCTNQNQQHSSTPMSQELVKYSPNGIESEPPKTIQMYPASSPEPVDWRLKEISPYLGRGQVVGSHFMRLADMPASTIDLVEKMQYLFVRVVKARELPAMEEISGILNPFVEVRLGKYRARTEPFGKQRQDAVWNEVLTFSRDQMRSKVIEVVVKDKVHDNDDEPVGIIRFDLNGVPTRIPPEDPLAPEWHRLEDKQTGEKTKGELMLAIWMGTRADDASDDAWDSDAAVALVDGSMAAYIRPHVYFSPRLWYVRVSIKQAEDLVVAEKSRIPKVCVNAQIGQQGLKTKVVHAPEFNPLWKEDLLFVAAEPFEDHLILSVEDFEGPNRVEVIGRVVIPLSSIEKRVDNRVIAIRRYQLEKPVAAVDVDQLKEEEELPGSLVLRLCLEGGYHVLDESSHFSSDLRPTAKELWNPPIGVLELGILRAEGLHPMKIRDGRRTTDAFCVARYGHEWVRTRTIVNSLTPKFDEHHTWDVYDLATVLTVALFDNNQLAGSSNTTSNNNDMKIGKVRIRLSTLQPGRLYTHSYPLLVLHPYGVKKNMGELLLAIKFSCTSIVNMMYVYSRPLLPKMHYIRPPALGQEAVLRYQAVNIVAARLNGAEPPLQKEVVEYMTDVDPYRRSFRRSKANFFHLLAVLSGLFTVDKWFGDVCTWNNVTTDLVIVLFVMLMSFNQLIVPLLLLYMSLLGIWNYRYRPRYPPHVDTRISYAEEAHREELYEEFYTFPTTKSPVALRWRYDCLRSVAVAIESGVGDVATQGERVLAFLSWRDPVATAIFVIFCIGSALVLFFMPSWVIPVVVLFHKMLHLWFEIRHQQY